MRELHGGELAGFIKERQARQVRALRQAHRVFPKLVVIKSRTSSPVIDAYVRMKQAYGDDILIETIVENCYQSDIKECITRYNNDPLVHGIIVQLPLDLPDETDEIVDTIAPGKDVDGLGHEAQYVSATAEAIDWLLAGYNIELQDKKIVLLGNGRLVGAPLSRLWHTRGYDMTVLDIDSKNIAGKVHAADVVISATGQPGLVDSSMLQKGAVVVDAGTASENGRIVGDVADDARARTDITITPIKGGVGPLTIALLYDHVIRAATAAAN